MMLAMMKMMALVIQKISKYLESKSLQCVGILIGSLSGMVGILIGFVGIMILNGHTLFPNGSPFGDPGPHGDLFGELGPHFMFWVPFFLYFRLKNAKE